MEALITALNPINMATIWRLCELFSSNFLLDCEYSTPITTAPL